RDWSSDVCSSDLAPVLGAGDQRAQVDGHDPLRPQTLGDIAVGDPACQPFDDGGLADTRFSYQDRVVLRTSGQDLDDAANLVIPADHRDRKSTRLNSSHVKIS